MSETTEKKLTQAQKNYLVKRINGIANTKISKLGGVSNYGTPDRYSYCNNSVGAIASKHNVGENALQAIIEGTVRLRSKEEMMAEIKATIDSKKANGFGSLAVLSFIDLKSLEKFNNAANKKKKEDYEAKQKRVALVRDEADKLKDSVMLEGHLASKLLEDFEKKEF